jgi:hypothetical protein
MFCQVTLYRDFVKLRSLALHNRNRAMRAMTEAGSETVTIDIGHDPSLAVYDLNRALLARRDTFSAPITFLLVDMNDIANHGSCLPSW